MLKYAIILHPTDFSLCSNQAFQVACSLARDHDGRLIILHVAEPPGEAYGGVMMAAPPPGDWQALDENRCSVLVVKAPSEASNKEKSLRL